MINVFIDSLENHERTQANKLLELYAYADKDKYRIADNPISADLILLCDVRFSNYGELLMKNSLLRKFTNKCFVLSNDDRPLPLFRGILTSAEKSMINFGRIRSCSYNAYSESFTNSFVANHLYETGIDPVRKYLFSFIGRDCNPVRHEILNMNFDRKDILVENSGATFNLYERRENFAERQKYYYDVMLQSKFVLCPGGWGANSYRLFEAMRLGVAPVIISDAWVMPRGPRWSDFSLIITNKDTGSLESRIAAREHDFLVMGANARKAYEQYFDDTVFFTFIIENCIQIKKSQMVPESLSFNFLTPLYIRSLKLNKGKLASMRNGLAMALKNPFDIFTLSTVRRVKRFLSK